MRLTPRWRKTVLTLHVITSVGWLGADLTLLLLGLLGLTGAADPAVVYPAEALIGLWLFVPLSVVVWVIGLVSALATPWGLVRHWWVLVKFALTTVMLGLVLFLLRPGLADALEADGVRTAHERLDMVMPPAVSSTVLIIATVLSTFKPWGRRQVSRARSRVVEGHAQPPKGALPCPPQGTS
ncbi:membrane protein [Virgisporangium aliadipatigenens]|uniref:Membrane protein n=1 Tax=Virgisporangium aliadipatigenens TaxID=741659 RepID=A0A8J4DLW4_9ACTN|nr:hypothetical protein [Virgisporangium aliadipatigenens]GIJ43150.1 membrane protein [Virgisporangium aliadipatigenens]